MARFGQLSYNQSQPMFIGQPVDDIKQVNAELINRYHTNLNLIDELQVMERNIEVEGIDHHILKDQIETTNNLLKDTAESGNYENASTVIREAYRNFKGNQGLIRAIGNKQKLIAADAEIDKRDDIPAHFRNLAKQYMRYNYQGVQKTEDGQWVGDINPINIPRYIDPIKIADDILKGINYNRENRGGFWDVTGADAQAATKAYLQKQGVTIESIDTDRVMNIVIDYLSENDEYNAYQEFVYNMEFFRDVIIGGRPITDNSIKGLLYNNIDFINYMNNVVPIRGETGAQTAERAKKEYFNKIDDLVNNAKVNIKHHWDKEGIEYEDQDIINAVHKNIWNSSNLQNTANILSSKYAFSKIDVIHDIRVNEHWKRWMQKQDEMAVSLLQGASIQLNPIFTYEERDKLRTSISETKHTISNLKSQRNSLVPTSRTYQEDLIKFNNMIRDNEEILRSLEIKNNDFNRILDSRANDVKIVVPRSLNKHLNEDQINEFIQLVKYGNPSEVTDFVKNALNNDSRNIMSLINDLRTRPDLSFGEYMGNLLDSFVKPFERVIEGNLYRSPSEILEDMMDSYISVYRNRVNRKFKEKPEYINTLSITTKGLGELEFVETQIRNGILNGSINAVDLVTNTNLQDEDFVESLIGATNITSSFGGITDPISGTNQAVYHISITDKDGNLNHHTFRIGDLGDQIINLVIDSYDKIINNPNMSPSTVNLLRTLNSHLKGSNINTDRGTNLANAIRNSGVVNFKIGDISQRDNPIKTPVGNLYFVKYGDSRYKAFIYTTDNQGNNIELDLGKLSNSIYFSNPTEVLPFMSDIVIANYLNNITNVVQ